jgi:hypothetical protein
MAMQPTESVNTALGGVSPPQLLQRRWVPHNRRILWHSSKQLLLMSLTCEEARILAQGLEAPS